MAERTKQAILGFVTDAGGQVVLQIATLVATPVILHLTSGSLYGFWLTVLSVLAYLGLVDLGIGISLTRIIAGMHGDNIDKEKFNRIVSTAFYLFSAAGLIFLVAGLVVAPFVPKWFKIPSAEFVSVISSYRWAVLAGAIALPLSTFGAIVTGTQHMAVNHAIRNIVSLASLGLSIGLLCAGFGLKALSLANLFNFTTQGLINYFYARRYCPYMKLRPSLINRVDLRCLSTFGGYFQLGRVANIVATNTDAVVIAAFLGAASVSPYVLTSKLAILFSTVFASKLALAVFPAVSQMFARRETKDIQRTFIGLAYYSVRLAIVGALVVALANRHFVTLWVGKDMFAGAALNAVFVYWIVQDTILHAVGVIVLASGDLQKWALAGIAEAAINIAATLLLIGPLGLPGVAIGTSIARTLATIYILVWICKKVELPLFRFVWRGLLQPIFRSAFGCIIIILFVLITPPGPKNWFWVIAIAGASALVNFASFEGIHFAQLSGKSWSVRFRQAMVQPWRTFYQ